MYQVLARKYRPHVFGDLIGQEHVKATIENAITKQRIAHGYIFAGQRGTGKTTVARIFARCLNCEKGPTPAPCGECASCREIPAGNSPDVIEIDAASNRGINEMRELRESVRYRPARDRYKVFIIDEAHQITNEAFNALLKTLEEPPEWVVFVLCTTETHKIPTTIGSRCQQFSFRSVDFQQVIDRMAWICQQENIEADPEALAVLAQAGGGSVRDSLSALDQAIAAAGTRLVADEVRGLLGMFSVESLGRVTDALLANQAPALIEIAFELERTGQSMQHFVRELARYFRNLVVIRIGGSDNRLVPATPRELQSLSETAANFSELDLTRYLQLALDLFRDLQHSLQPRLHLELGLLRMLYASRLISIEEALANPGLAVAGLAAASPAPKVSPAASKPAESFGRDSVARSATKPMTEPVKVSVSAPRLEPIAAAVSVARSEVPNPPPTALPADASLSQKLAKAAEELGMTFTADAIRHAVVEESAGELLFSAPSEFLISLRDKQMPKIIQTALGKAYKVKLQEGSGESNVVAATKPKNAGSEEAMERALAHPAVQQAQSLFGATELKNVRDLKGSD
jgi:DNA polymerase III subunit gamma/tau